MYTVNACIVFVVAIVRESKAALAALRSFVLAYVVRPSYRAGVRWMDTVLSRTATASQPRTVPVLRVAPANAVSVVLSAADLAPIVPTIVPADAMLTRDRVQPHDESAHVVSSVSDDTAPVTLPMPRKPRQPRQRKGKVAAQVVATEAPVYIQPARLYTDADLAGMNRKALQTAVKVHRAALPPEVKANSTNDAIRAALALLTA